MEKFYLGLDIGTQSVGIACTDEQYRLLRAKRKDLWAVRLFDEAKDAHERRIKRTARRRLLRKEKRIDFLQDIFAPYMEDSLFFLRLNNSPFLCGDKDPSISEKYTLFADENFTDKDYHRAFPTIFHLRKTLIAADKKYDLRFYYLAIHHIVKYRGHFLFEGETMRDATDIGRLFRELNAVSETLFDENAPIFDPEKTEVFVETAVSGKNMREKLNQCCRDFGVTADQKQKKEMLNLLIGGTVKTEILFDSKFEGIKSLSFNKISEEEFEAIKNELGDYFSLLECAKAIFDAVRFRKILGENEFISHAMVDIYNRHKRDLQALKKLVKGDRALYIDIFKDTNQKFNYANYVGYSKPQKRKIMTKKCKPEDFFKWLKKTLTEHAAELPAEELEEILSKIEKGEFLPKILHADNGVIPHQVNGMELEAILKNLARDYPEFLRKDEEGYSAVDKIKALFRFQIPYYVGPLNTAHEEKKDGQGGNSWMVRKKKGKITPWNFDEMVDKAASNEKFMRRMTNQCTYLRGKDVLPKNSILYQKFDVLNQLNKLQLNGEPIGIPLKQQIFNDLFLKYPKVTDRHIRTYLEKTGIIKPGENLMISEKDGDLKCSMSSYIALKKILGDRVDTMSELCENVILWHTLNTDKKVVEGLIRDRYGKILTDQEIKALKGLTFKDFGRLSREFLCELPGGVDGVTGEIYTILGELYNTNMNLNEILYHEKYAFRKEIENENCGTETVSYEDLEKLYVSPQVRRGIWQALQLTDEYVSAVGRAPDKIFIEVTRAPEKDTGRKKSRKQQLLALYQTQKDIDELTKKLNHKTDSELRSERLYLYFKQFGKCAYSGKTIDLGQLNGDTYDIDHILPRAYSKDDSLDNKVLVLREKNARKGHCYPVPEDCRQKNLWDYWKQAGAISEKKYALLTRTNPLTEADFEGFIQKQIVVTNQTVKATAELLKRKYGNSGTNIVYSKARNVVDFKNLFDIVKCRMTNDLHHARDAYLNVAVGNVYDTRFSSYREMYVQKGNEWREIDFTSLFFQNIPEAWKKEDSLKLVKMTVQKTSMAVTRYTYTSHGKFYNETVYPKNENLIPRKLNSPYQNTARYGGYKSPATAYFSIVRSLDSKGEPIKTIEAVPVLTDYQIKAGKQTLVGYFEEQKLIRPEILTEKVKMKTLLSYNGFLCRIAGITENRIIVHNAVQWFTSAETDRYANALAKMSEWDRSGLLTEKEQTIEFVDHTNRLGEKKIVVNVEENMKLLDLIIQALKEKKAYSGVTGLESFYKNLEKHRADFEKLKLTEQAEVLLQCIRFMKCNAECADLSLLNEGKSCGKLLINKKIGNNKIVLIHQSPCGLVERRRPV